MALTKRVAKSISLSRTLGGNGGAKEVTPGSQQTKKYTNKVFVEFLELHT
jgi:hypothetical protein